MKRSLLVGLAAVGFAAALPNSRVLAETTTTTLKVPTECWVTFDAGPSRTSHSAPDKVAIPVPDIPECSEIAGICVTVTYEVGPARVTHSRPALPVDPCVPLGPACDITVNYYSFYDDGPGRPVHQVSSRPRPESIAGGTVDIPAPCEDLWVLAFGPTGSETGPTIWIATAFLGAGALLIVAPRRLARR